MKDRAKRTHEEVIDELPDSHVEVLKKQCEWIGITLDDIDLGKRDWYTDYSWSKGEEKEFEEWLADKILSDDELREELCQYPHHVEGNRKKALEVAGRNSIGWTFDYGWTMKEYDIPDNTPYCYEQRNGEHYQCPYWNRVENGIGRPEYYCEYMDKYDSVDLGDQVKICGVKEGYNEEEQ